MKNEMVDVRTAAADVKVSESLLRQLARDNKVPHYRLSARTLRFDLTELRDYMRFIAEGKPAATDR